jgi:hypothetical protein
MKKLTDRMKALISHKTTELKKYKELEELTGITTATWRSWWNRGGTPSGEMIEAVGKIWPEYAFWLVTGVSDALHGHSKPSQGQAFRPRTAARDLFLAQIKLDEWCDENPISLEEHQQYRAAEWGTWPNNNSELAKRIDQWVNMTRKVDELSTIRSAQEDTLEKFEIDEENKKPLPF